MVKLNRSRKLIEKIKIIFINKHSKVQILPSFNVFMIIVVLSFLYLKTSNNINTYTELIASSLLAGNLIGWGLREIYFRDNYLYSWLGVIILLLGLYTCWSLVSNLYTVII